MKKFRSFFKIIVRSAIFDNSMLLSVLLNTCIMAMEKHGMDQYTVDILETGNTWFTWIFICEMNMKLIGIGFKKYCD